MSGHGFLEKRWLRLDKLDTPVRRVIFTTFTVLVALALAILVRKDIAGPSYPISHYGYSTGTSFSSPP